MSACNPKVKIISSVPQKIIDLLLEKIKTWNYVTDDFLNSDIVFLKNNTLSFHKNLEDIKPVIDWCKAQIDLPDSIPMRAMFNAIPPNTRCPAHVDTVKFHVHSLRLHIPLINAENGNHYTFDNIEGTWQSTKWHMEFGQLYQLDNFNVHAVENNGKDWRINFILDLLPCNLLSKHLDWYSLDAEQTVRLKRINDTFYNDPILTEWSYKHLKTFL